MHKIAYRCFDGPKGRQHLTLVQKGTRFLLCQGKSMSKRTGCHPHMLRLLKIGFTTKQALNLWDHLLFVDTAHFSDFALLVYMGVCLCNRVMLLIMIDTHWPRATWICRNMIELPILPSHASHRRLFSFTYMHGIWQARKEELTMLLMPMVSHF